MSSGLINSIERLQQQLDQLINIQQQSSSQQILPQILQLLQQQNDHLNSISQTLADQGVKIKGNLPSTFV